MTSSDSMELSRLTKINSEKSKPSISQSKPDPSFFESKKNHKSPGKGCLECLCSRHRKSDKSEKMEQGVSAVYSYGGTYPMPHIEQIPDELIPTDSSLCKFQII